MVLVSGDSHPASYLVPSCHSAHSRNHAVLTVAITHASAGLPGLAGACISSAFLNLTAPVRILISGPWLQPQPWLLAFASGSPLPECFAAASARAPAGDIGHRVGDSSVEPG